MVKFAKVLLLAVGLFIFSSATVKAINVGAEEHRVFDLVNAERRRNSLDKFEWNERLAEIARSYSQRMARERFFGHVDPDGNRVEVRAREFNSTKTDKIGENLFTCAGYDNVASFALSRWMNSASHRANILDEEYVETGIGIAETSRGEIYITQIFVNP